MNENEEKPTPRRGRPAGKVEAKRETREKDAQILRAAFALLELTPTKDCQSFNVTRQTLAKWLRGETSAPREAYVYLLDKVIEAATKGTGNTAAVKTIAEAAAQRAAEATINERLQAILERLDISPKD